jgi:hypothetical protein
VCKPTESRNACGSKLSRLKFLRHPRRKFFQWKKQGRGSCGQETPTKHHGNMFEIAQVLPKNKRKSAPFTKE